MTPTPPPETSDERRLQDDAEKRVYESKVCSRFSTAMGQPHCQTCGRNEDLHTIRGLLKALAAERSSREAHALPREVQDAIKFIELLVGECDPGTSDHAWRKCKRCLAIHEVQNNGRPAMRLLKAAVDRLGFAQQAGESARLREGLEAIEALLTEELRERFGQAEHTRSSRRMFCLLVIPRNIARNALQAAAAPSGAAEPTHGHTKGTD
jgi:hypothetical protein